MAGFVWCNSNNFRKEVGPGIQILEPYVQLWRNSQMKKSLIALAALAAVSAASAQSTVTISGTVTAGHQTIAAAKSVSGLDATNSNLLNFAMVEDLGGGLKATANIGIRFDVNQSLTSTGFAFGKSTGDQYVDLTSDKLGGIRAGTFTSYSAAPMSPFATWTAARLDSTISATSAQSIAYTSPTFSGFKVKLTSFVPFTATATTDITAHGGQQIYASYANGPVAASYMTMEFTAIGETTPIKFSTLDASYDFTVAKVFASTWEQKSATGIATNKGSQISLNVPVGAWNFKVGARKNASYTSSMTAGLTDRTSLGATYSLSKRTTVVALYSKDKKISDTSVKTNNTYLGVQHAF